jgi:hypothetical protein
MKRQKGMHDEIARIAYELSEKRGWAHGHELEDWLEAEQIVMERHERHERHERETEQGTDVILKPREGFRQTVKKEGSYKKA